MNKSVLIAALVSVAFCATTVASETSSVKAGTLHSIDFAANTLSIEDEKGNIQAFSFTANTRTIVEGRAMNLRRALKPGQQVELKLRSEKLAQASL